MKQIVTSQPDGTVNIVEASHGIVFRPTLNLRWSKEGTLQQAWQDMLSGETEWRDVPTEVTEGEHIRHS